MANGQGTAILDFGAAPGSNEASVVVTGQAAILATSKAEAYIMATDTSVDHSASDHRYVGCWLGLTCAVGVVDTFTRVNSATTMGTSDSGHLWVPNSGVWGISSNQAYLVSGTQCTTVVDSTVADGTVTGTIPVGGGADAGLCWRSTDDANHFLFSPGQAYSKIAGAFTPIGGSTSWTAGDVLTVILSGTSHTLKKNGTTFTNYTSSFNQTATKHGLRNYSDTTVRFDDFSVVGGGFTIYGRSLEQLEGKYTVRYVWSD